MVAECGSGSHQAARYGRVGGGAAPGTADVVDAVSGVDAGMGNAQYVVMPALLQSSSAVGAASVVGATTIISASFAAALAGAVMAAALSAMVGHGILRPLLEARGIVPWTVRDSLGSLPLVIFGSALAAGSTIYGAARFFSAEPLVRVLCLALLCAGLLAVRLGLLALRKLT